MGAGSRSAADDVPGRRGVRALLPPVRLDEPAGSNPARRAFRYHERDARRAADPAPAPLICGVPVPADAPARSSRRSPSSSLAVALPAFAPGARAASRPRAAAGARRARGNARLPDPRSWARRGPPTPCPSRLPDARLRTRPLRGCGRARAPRRPRHHAAGSRRGGLAGDRIRVRLPPKRSRRGARRRRGQRSLRTRLGWLELRFTGVGRAARRRLRAEACRGRSARRLRPPGCWSAGRRPATRSGSNASTPRTSRRTSTASRCRLSPAHAGAAAIASTRDPGATIAMTGVEIADGTRAGRRRDPRAAGRRPRSPRIVARPRRCASACARWRTSAT